MATLQELWGRATYRGKQKNIYSDMTAADLVTFDPTIKAILVSTNVQDAIDELSTGGASIIEVVLSAITPAEKVFTLDAANEAVVVTCITAGIDPTQIVGITLEAGAAGATVKALLFGRFTSSVGGYAPVTDVWLDNTGSLTNTTPAVGTVINLGYSITATEIYFDKRLAEVDEYDWITVGDPAQDALKGIDCDLFVADLATTVLTNAHVVLRRGDYTGVTVQFAGQVTLFQDPAANLAAVNLANGTVLTGNLACTDLTVTAAGTAAIHETVFNITTSINTAAGLRVCKGCTQSIPNVTGNITLQTVFVLTNIGTTSANLTLQDSYIDGNVGACGGTIEMFGSDVAGNVGNIVTDFTMDNSHIGGTVGTIGDDLRMTNSYIVSTVAAITDDLEMNSSYIDNNVTSVGGVCQLRDSYINGTVGNIGGDLDLELSYIDDTIGNVTGYVDLETSHIDGNVGTIGGTLGIENGYIDGTVGNITGIVTLENAFIDGIVGTCGANVNMKLAYIDAALGAVTGTLDMEQSFINGAVTSVGTDLDMEESYIDGNVGTIGNDLIMNDAHIDGTVGNIVANATMNNAYITGAIGNVPGTLTMNHSWNAGVGNVGTDIFMFASRINGSVGTVSTNIQMRDSSISQNVGVTTGTIDMVNSNIAENGAGTIAGAFGLSMVDSSAEIADTGIILNLGGYNSDLTITDVTANLAFMDRTDIRLRFPLTAAQQVTFGDGTAINDFINCEIKIYAQQDGANQLTIVDNPNGAGTTYADNVFDLLFGGAATFNVTGGNTNILIRKGDSAGVTDTANNYTVVEQTY